MRILHAIHDFLPRHRAGSEIYAFHLCRQLSGAHDVAVLAAEYDPSRPHGSLTRREHEGLPVFEIVNNWQFDSFDETYASPLIGAALDGVLARFAPDVLHIHSLLNLSLDLPRLARDRGIPSVATLHDYTLVCPSGGQRVHIAEQHVCGTIDPDRCARCFPQSAFHAQIAARSAARLAGKSAAVRSLADNVRRRAPRLFSTIVGMVSAPATRLAASDIEKRLAAVHRMYEDVDLFVAPSASLGDELVALGLPKEKLHVSDYGFVPLARSKTVPGTVLRIGFVGTLAWHKGAHVLVEAASKLERRDFEVLVYGDLSVFPEYARQLEAAASGLPVRLLGGFDESRIEDVYASIDVLVVPSLWPENSPLVIHEAFMAGVPVVGARQGGIPGLVGDGESGLLYDASSSDELASALARILDDPGLLERFASALPAVKSIAEDAAEWEAVYESVGARNRPRTSAAS